MQTEFLIVGQGISGSLLYHSLTKAGARCMVIDDNKPNAASKVAAGLINPVTGRRLVKSWMIDDLIPVLRSMYQEIEKDFNIKCFYETELTWHLPATDIVEAFEKRFAERTDFLAEANTAGQQAYFNFPFKAGNISPCYIVDVQLLLDSIRAGIDSSGNLLNELFNHQHLQIKEEEVQYKNLRAKKIIYCEGSSAINNPWFSQLPYSLNKGEALILSINGLPRQTIYKFKQTLVPLPGNDNLWWYGSNYVWQFQDDLPTKDYRNTAERELRAWLKLPFTIVDHKAAIRYATVERRPFVGFHPSYPAIGIFNGWGTKGCSLVPYFANQFVDSILRSNQSILAEANVNRFSKLLVSRPV
jgi:glycine/D-amino acid oxidase-like deaminating enzyme